LFHINPQILDHTADTGFAVMFTYYLAEHFTNQGLVIETSETWW